MRELIRKILNEEVPPQVRRRIPTFDDAFIHYRDAFNNYTHGNFNVYWWNVMERVLETLYHAWFINTVPDDEWEESEKYIKDYLTEKYYEDTKKWWSKHRNRHRLQESEGKKSSFLSKMEEDGLYDFISNTGLHINQIEQKVGQLSREVLERFIIDMVKEHHNDMTTDGQTHIMDLDYAPFNPIPVDENDYVEQITTRNNELFFTVVLYEEDEYGDLDYSSHEVVSPKDLSYDNIYEIAGLLAFNLIKERI